MARPKGRKNNKTLLREAELERCLKICEGTAATEAPLIVLAMAEKAKQGDVSAAKLILDRVYPAMRSVEERAGGKDLAIQINIINSEEYGNAEDSDGCKTITFSDLPANGEVSEVSEGIEVFAQDGSEEGNKPH